MSIRSFGDAETERLFRIGRSVRWQSVAKLAIRKLDMLNAACALRDLCSPPGNRLEAVRGDRAGFQSIRINDQFRLCFRWTEEGPEHVHIIDYH